MASPRLMTGRHRGKPCPRHENGDVIQAKHPGLRPGNAVHGPVRKRPQKGRGIEVMGMGGDVEQDVQSPTAHFPAGSAAAPASDSEHGREDDGAVAEAVQERRQRINQVATQGWMSQGLRVGELSPRQVSVDDAEEEETEQRREGHEIGRNAPGNRAPRAHGLSAFRQCLRPDRCPQAMRQNVHY